ncbi:MAG TPA: low affinity iron permease family protein [Caulobacteraceae bacterium]|nr:low affinity iron permease family protein [Caulobacteraceae bacterium]
MWINRAFTQFANMVSRLAGRSWAFMACILFVLVWAATGPAFGFSDTWQLVINTSTTIITFLMVFLIQNTQNRDNAALQAKLDELIRISAAENRYIGIERLTDRELEGILEEVEENAEVIEDTGAQAKPVAAVRNARSATSRKKASAKKAATGTRKRA